MVASIAAVQAPASAAPARTTFSQPSPVHLGDSSPQASAPSATAIEIPDSAAPADPYPSTVSFDRPGVITDVDVAITGITHESPDDLQLLLVGPGGDQALLMAHVSNGEAVDDIDISFDDEGMLFETNQPLEDTAAYQPTSVAPVDFPGEVPDLDGNTALGVFNGASPVGDWQLFVHDSVAGNGGTIGSWNLSFELATSPYPSTLSVSGIGEVTDVDVSLHDIDSDFPRDSDVLLVGPQGHQSVLMSDVGGTVRRLGCRPHSRRQCGRVASRHVRADLGELQTDQRGQLWGDRRLPGRARSVAGRGPERLQRKRSQRSLVAVRRRRPRRAPQRDRGWLVAGHRVGPVHRR